MIGGVVLIGGFLVTISGGFVNTGGAVLVLTGGGFVGGFVVGGNVRRGGNVEGIEAEKKRIEMTVFFIFAFASLLLMFSLSMHCLIS